MLSWELPPTIVGGVGMVCAEICKGLCKYDNLTIEYAMPYGPQEHMNFSSNCKVIGVQHQKVNSQFSISHIPTLLSCYQTPEEYEDKYQKVIQIKPGGFKTPKELYGANILQEVQLYAQRVVEMYKDSSFDVIHAHDWTTMLAAIELKKITGIPVIYHVHITEYDKTGNNGGHPEIIEMEKYGLENADSIIAVSNYVKHQLLTRYQADESKIRVVHNAIISDLVKSMNRLTLFEDKKVILFMGRMTLQKGPEYFLRAAKKALEFRQDLIFIMAGGGDMLNKMIDLSFELGINEHVFFHGGAYTRVEAERYYSSSDVFIMPSVSEPFGVVPYEAAVKGTPVIISKQSGISEVFNNSMKVDFWDIDEMAHKILCLLEYDVLHSCIRQNAYNEVDLHTWDNSIQLLVDTYSSIRAKK
ncbi:MAG: glycosyltransferase family 4 protein [Candidatus Nanoarchaeia archaeon]